MFSLFIIFCLPRLVHAYNSFKTNCTLPSDTPAFNFVSSPNVRGTLDIAWSCLFTIISCTWTIQHPNIPWQREHFRPGALNWLTWKLSNYFVFLWWFLGTIIAPEYLLTKYLDDYIQAKRGAKKFAQLASDDNVEWTPSHHQFARMGGFVMRTHVASFSTQYSDKSVQTEKKSHENSDGAIVQTISPFPSQADKERDFANHESSASSVPMQKEAPQAHQKINTKPTYTPNGGWKSKRPNPFYLQPRDILMLRREGVLSRLPDITEEEIQDRSKADGLMRTIAMIQICWLFIQVITRWSANIAVTQLEVSTVAFAICAIIIYVLSWEKPKGVNIPITILKIHDNGEKAHSLLSATLGTKLYISVHQERTMDFTLPETEATPWGLGITGVIFGGIHLAAWDFIFPTQIESILWRVAAIYCTCAPIVVLLNWSRKLNLYWRSPKFTKARIKAEIYLANPSSFSSLQDLLVACWRCSRLFFILFFFYFLAIHVFLLAYFVARLFLLVEMLRTLAYQPTSAYTGTWTVNIPYFS